jgi:hypothetical protein
MKLGLLLFPSVRGSAQFARMVLAGYYPIGVLPRYRGNGGQAGAAPG